MYSMHSEFVVEFGRVRVLRQDAVAGDRSVITADLAVGDTVSQIALDRVDHAAVYIVPGYDADMVVLDEQYNVVQCYVGGKEQVK